MENFLFSYSNKAKKPEIQLKSNNTNTQYSSNNNSGYGPTFGGGHDIYISNNCDSNSTSYSNVGYTYSLDGYSYGSNDAKNFLAGSYNFTVTDIEVFALKK